ncbi:pyridoxamine 5'-phosphate oxidase family protein [Mesorhizobium sp. BAC0120]|uniref:pyridoxamine 5'-phosphate oxidase family protein n=1 Tax=Mesorhizobium sp. BAC0120 TaxID=3090670 RepID=UPI00298C35A2|nr:pyridoxamine 5'-phosphate oxidase family protein [Mesorhizobium sp. BAC0120]MDW6022517.1 pyridoxamine 5'-phosphate oxidase family protein [Mesorhizobium sp. BAC0120]
MLLTEEMKGIVARHSIGFVATVNADGTPNLSPKGTMVALDDDRILFGEIRSPGTLRNIRANPSIEINFLDIFIRKAVRIKGTAMVITKGSSEFAALRHHFDRWGELAELIRNFIEVEVRSAAVVTTPAYDLGATEDELSARWKDYYSGL